jgi:hypothetical protein
MLGDECKEVKVKCLELEVVLDLIGFHEWVDKQTYRNCLELVKGLLEVHKEHFSDCLVLWAFNQAEDQGLEKRRSTVVLFVCEFVQESEHMSNSHHSHPDILVSNILLVNVLHRVNKVFIHVDEVSVCKPYFRE